MIVLKVLFAALVIAAAYFGGSRVQSIEISPVVGLIALGLASARFGRLVTFNGIFADLRQRFGIVPEPDSSGAGDSDVCHNPTPVTNLLMCPVCTSTWGAAILVLIYLIWASLGIVLVLILAATAIGEVLIWGNEVLEWGGRLIRVVDGELETRQKERLAEAESESESESGIHPNSPLGHIIAPFREAFTTLIDEAEPDEEEDYE